MGNKVNKGFFFYLMVLLGIAVGVALLGIAVMMLGKVTIFGISYFSYNETDKVSVNDSVYVLDSAYEVPEDGTMPEGTTEIEFNKLFLEKDVQKIIIDSQLHSFSAIARSSAEENAIVTVGLTVNTNVKGFTKNEDKGAYKVVTYFQNNVLTLKVIGLDNFINFANSSTIQLEIPQSKLNYFSSRRTELEVTSKSGNITIGKVLEKKDDPLYVPDVIFGGVKLKTDSGSIRLTKYVELVAGFSDYRNSSFETVSGTITIDRDSTTEGIGEEAVEIQQSLEFGEVVIKTQNGNITINRQFETEKDVKISCVRSYISIDNVACKTLEFTGESGKMVAKKIVGNVAIQEQTKFTKFKFDEVIGSFYVYGSKNSDVEIGKLNVQNETDTANINTTNGNVKIDEVVGSVIIETTTGKVDITKCSAELNVESKSGDINIAMKGESTDGNVIITSEKSDVTITKMATQLTLTGNGNINVEFIYIANSTPVNSVINAETGKVNVLLSNDYRTKLTVNKSSSVIFDNNDRGDHTEEPFVVGVNSYTGTIKTLTITSNNEVVVDIATTVAA